MPWPCRTEPRERSIAPHKRAGHGREAGACHGLAAAAPVVAHARTGSGSTPPAGGVKAVAVDPADVRNTLPPPGGRVIGTRLVVGIQRADLLTSRSR
jgi:hypothetical protein